MQNTNEHDASKDNDAQEALSSTYTPDTPSYKSLLFYSFIALGIALFVRFFIAAPYIVSGASMEPTFNSWNYLIVDRISYQFEEPERGDVVVFRFPEDPSRSFIKRIIGLPKETVMLRGTEVTIKNNAHPNGFTLDEAYIAIDKQRATNMTIELGEDEYFVLGDNRLQSADSRVWGSLPKELLVGRAFLRLFPIPEIDILPGKVQYAELQ